MIDPLITDQVPRIVAHKTNTRPAWWQIRRRRRYDEQRRFYASLAAKPGTRCWREIERQPLQ